MDIYDYTQKPEEQRTFTVTDIQRITGSSPSVIRSIAERAGIEGFVNKDRHNVVVYDFKSMKQIVAIYRNYMRIDDVVKINKRRASEPKTIEQLRKEHPLVKDDKFFKLTYFPDIVPKCFADD